MDDLLDLVDAALAEPVEILELRISAELGLGLVYDGGGTLIASWPSTGDGGEIYAKRTTDPRPGA